MSTTYFQITPGYQFTANESVTYAKLNLLGQPVISPTVELFNILTAFKNGFINGNFQVWQRPLNPWPVDSAQACPAATKTWWADRWFARPTGAAISYKQAALLPTGAIAAYSARLVGAASVTTVDFGQRIESADATTNWNRTRTFSAWIYNDTGAAFTPKLRINTPSAADAYATNTNRRDATLQACASGAWTQVSDSFDGATLTNITNGAEVVLQFPSGTLDASGKSVYITQVQCEPGSVVTAQEPRLYSHELQLCQRYALRLINQVVGFAGDATNLPNKGIMTYPTTMRARPVFNTSNTAIADGTWDFFTATAGLPGLPAISNYAAEVIFACANASANWTPGAQINLTCVLTAEDQT